MSADNAVDTLRELADVLEGERKVVAKLLAICREVDVELDGVRVPAVAAERLNALRLLLKRIDEEDWS